MINETKKLLHGFQLIEKKEIKEIKVTAYRYQHLQSGADLMHYQCDDDNKVFMIGFKTVPEDNKRLSSYFGTRCCSER